MDENKEQIEILKRELALFLKIAKKLNYPKVEIDKQAEVYLDSINKLKKKSS